MPYEPSIDVVRILRATLCLLENSQYPEKGFATIEALLRHLHSAIADLEAAARIPPHSEEPELPSIAAKVTQTRRS